MPAHEKTLQPASEKAAEYAADAASIAALIAAGELPLAEMPDSSARSPEQHALAARIHRSLHDVRARFLIDHGLRLYEQVTAGYSRHMRLPELAFAVADLVPGILPTRQQIEQERSLTQGSKEGHELEQGVFFATVLRDQRAGNHLIEGMLRPTRQAMEALPRFRASGAADLGNVLVERKDGAAWLTVRNLKYLNAEDNETVQALELGVDLALLDDQVQVGVVRGAPMTHAKHTGRRIFNAGINLTHLYNGQISLIDFLLNRELGYLNKILRGISTGRPDIAAPERTEKPWLALVDGFAIGGGTQQLLGFDRVIAESRAYFRVPALNEGIIPGAANLRLTRCMGARLSRRMIIWDQAISAADPDALLLCDEVVPAESMEQNAWKAIERLANPAVVPNRRLLTLAEEPLDAFRAYVAEYALEQSRLLYNPHMIASLEQMWINRKPGGGEAARRLA